MVIELSNGELVELMAQMLRCKVEEAEGVYIFTIPIRDGVKRYNLFSSKLDELRKKLASLNVIDELMLVSPEIIEVAIKEESRIPLGVRRRDNGLSIEDPENGCHYILGCPSDEYILFLFTLLPDLREKRISRIITIPSYVLNRMMDESGDNVIALIGKAVLRIWSIRVETGSSRSFDSLKSLVESMLFQLTYNLDASLVVQRHVDEVFRFRRIIRNRRSRIEEIDPPRRKYIPDIVYHYQLGVASDNHLLEYLSYYHVAEHFFETVFNDDLVESIKSQITDPGFSYRRKSDVRKIIKLIGKSLSLKDEKVSFNEQSALQLTISRYVDLRSLKSKIEEYDDSLLDYYRSEPAGFSGGSVIDFELGKQVVLKNLSKRIYLNRCALVHSKESDKSKFVPFRDDKQLLKEVPLMRFVSEEIIINSSEMIG